MIGAIIMILACAVLVLQKNINVLIVFRVVKGLGLGFIASAGPMYMGEMSTPERRGSVVSTYQLFITFGILFDYVINYLFHDITDGWRFFSN